MGGWDFYGLVSDDKILDLRDSRTVEVPTWRTITDGPTFFSVESGPEVGRMSAPIWVGVPQTVG